MDKRIDAALNYLSKRSSVQKGTGVSSPKGPKPPPSEPPEETAVNKFRKNQQSQPPPPPPVPRVKAPIIFRRNLNDDTGDSSESKQVNTPQPDPSVTPVVSVRGANNDTDDDRDDDSGDEEKKKLSTPENSVDLNKQVNPFAFAQRFVGYDSDSD